MMKKRFAKKSFFLLFSLLGFLSLISFQNCSRVNFHPSSQESDFLKSENNGGYYTGKPIGSFYHFVPGFTCQSLEAPESILDINDKEALLTENKNLLCGGVKQNLVLESIDASIYQNEIIGYQERIFEGAKSVPTSIPANLVEVWCKDRSDVLGIETILHFDRNTRTAVNRIYYSDISETGRYTNAKIPDFAVSRVITLNQVQVRSEQHSFELTVYRDQPAPQVGLFKANLKVVIAGKLESRETYCRLGGSIDTTLWPAKLVVDLNVNSFKISPDNNTLAFTSGTLTGVPVLYTTNFNGSSEKQVSLPMLATGVRNDISDIGTNFQFTPDSKSIIYSGDPRIPNSPELFKVNTDGSNHLQLSQVISNIEQSVRPDFIISKDSTQIIYQENRFGSIYPPTVKSLSLNDGTSHILSPFTTGSAGSISVLKYYPEQNKLVYHFGNESGFTKLYSVSLDGTGLTDLAPSMGSINYAPSYYSVRDYHNNPNGGMFPLNYQTLGNYHSYVNYLIPINIGNPIPIPSGWFWVFSDPTGSYALLSSWDANASNHLEAILNLKTMNLKTIKLSVQSLTYKDNNSDFFTDDGSNLIAKMELPGGNYKAVSVNSTTGDFFDLCPGLASPQLMIKQLRQGEYLIQASYPMTQIIDIYLSSNGISCRKLNSTLSTITGKGLYSYALSADKQKLLIQIWNKEIIYIPLNGNASYVVNAPVFSSASIQQYGFLPDDKTVYFIGNQTRQNEVNIYTWSPPSQ